MDPNYFEHARTLPCDRPWGKVAGSAVLTGAVGGAAGWSDASPPLVQRRENIFHLDRPGHRGQGDRGSRFLPVRAHRLLAELPGLATVPARRRPARELSVHPGRAGL